MEAGIIKESIELFAGSANLVIKRFELDEGDTDQGMICGGAVDVLIERIGPQDLSLFSQSIDVRDEGGDCTLLRGVDPTKGNVHRVVVAGTTHEGFQRSPFDELCEVHGVPMERFHPSLQRAHREGSVERVSGLNGELIIQPIVGTQPLVIFGGGHVGRALSKIAALTGFSVTVVDDREEYAQSNRFPEAARTISNGWRTAFDGVKDSAATSIVIVTRGHQSDGEVLRQAVATRARYIGMIGSKKKVAATFTRLLNDGTPLSVLKRIQAPIGLDIGAVTAEEIAASILAELIRARRGFQDVSAPMSSQMISWFDHQES